MNPQLSKALATEHLLLFSAVAIGLLFIEISYAVRPPHQRSVPRKINGKLVAEKQPQSHRISFSENGPAGRWSASFVPDKTQSAGTSPVVITGNSTLMGNAQLRNLQLTHVTLKNHSEKTVLGIQLKWFITTRSNPAKILPPPGYTGLFETRLPSRTSEKFESPVIKFSQVVKHLLKEGRLEGEFLVQVRVYQVEFDDGSSWNDDWGGPKPGESGTRWQGPIC